jgi:hypothetical protein
MYEKHKHVLENNHHIYFDINIDLEILNIQNNIYINSVLEVTQCVLL